MSQRHPGVLADRRAEVLSQLVLLFTEGRDPVDLAEDSVQMVARAAGAAAAFVYLWDEEAELLVLRVGTPGPQRTGVGEVRLRLGEGITGWAALRQQSVIIDGAPRDDPRYIESDKVGETEFHSALAVPIADGQGQLRGVFSLYSLEESAFGKDELAIAVEVGRLLASGLVRAETNEDLNRQSAIARFLVDFPTASRTGLVSSLQFAARKMLDLLDAEVCVLEYMSRRDSGTAPVIIALRTPTGEHRVWLTHSKSAAQATVDQHGHDMNSVAVSLGMNASKGVLTCYRHRRFRPSDLDRLSNLTAQLSVLLETVDLNSVGSSLATQLLFCEQDDQTARMVEELGIEGPVFAVVVRLSKIRGDADVAIRSLREVLSDAVGKRSIVLLDSTWGIALVPAPGGRVPSDISQHLLSATETLARDIGLGAAIGIGSIAQTPGHARKSIVQAREALGWAEHINCAEPIALTTAADIRDAQSLPQVVSELAPDVLNIVHSLEPLAGYDIEQGTELLKTLSVLATCGGSVQGAVTRLFIHRNTLRQRMQRIEQILGTSLGASTNWVAWSLAARIADHRVMESRQEPTS